MANTKPATTKITTYERGESRPLALRMHVGQGSIGDSGFDVLYGGDGLTIESGDRVHVVDVEPLIRSALGEDVESGEIGWLRDLVSDLVGDDCTSHAEPEPGCVYCAATHYLRSGEML